jgi:hypothetical protein
MTPTEYGRRVSWWSVASEAVNFFVDDKEKLHVDVHFSPTEAAFINYIRLTGQFNFDFSTFSGEAIAYDDDGEQFEGAHYSC